MSLEKPRSTPSQLWSFPPKLLLKQFPRSSDWQWPCLVPSRKITEHFHFPSPPPSQAIDGVMYMALHTQCLKLLNTSYLLRCNPFVMTAFPTRLYAPSFPSVLACPGQYIQRSLPRWTLNTTHASLGFPIHYKECSITKLKEGKWSHSGRDYWPWRVGGSKDGCKVFLVRLIPSNDLWHCVDGLQK